MRQQSLISVCEFCSQVLLYLFAYEGGRYLYVRESHVDIPFMEENSEGVLSFLHRVNVEGPDVLLMRSGLCVLLGQAMLFCTAL